MRGIAVGLLMACASAWAAPEAQEPAVVFDPRPSAAELVPLNAEERRASVIVLNYSIAINASVSAWSGKTKNRTRYTARYLVVDNAGVRNVAQHHFFGDESDVEIVDIQGRTIDPDGNVYPIDPDKDIRTLDASSADGGGTFRTVNFPRVAPGAVLDLTWAVESEGRSFDSVALLGQFPVRTLHVTSKGTLMGFGGLLLGNPQIYRVPFFFARIPPNVEARLSNNMDLDLTARNLGVSRDEPSAPPKLRTNAVLGILPMQFSGFGGGKWRKHVYLFGDDPVLPEQHGSDPVWVTGTLEPDFALAQLDELDLQRVPLSKRNNASLDFYQRGARGMANRYRKFAAKHKTAEQRDQVEQIAPSSLPWSERVDRLFAHARSRVLVDPEGRAAGNLDKLLKNGRGPRTDLLYYLKYLTTVAGIPNAIVIVFDRFGPPFLPLFETWRPFPRSVLLEVGPPDGPRRYLEPGDVFANAHSFDDSNLGGVLMREPAGKGDWTIDRLPIDAPVSKRTVVNYSATLGTASAKSPLTVDIEYHDSAADARRWLLGYPFNKTDAEKLAERRQRVVKLTLGFWTGKSIADDAEVPVPDPLADVAGPLRMHDEIAWTPDIQSVGAQLLVPALPPAKVFDNRFVTEQRQHPLWLSGGDVEVNATWRLPAGYRVADLKPRHGDGPGGLHYAIERSSDPVQSSVTTHVEIHEPYLLPASAYAEVRSFFEALQRDASAPLLLEH